MASLGSFAVDLITRLGGKPSPGAEKLFNAWQRWEGGHTANSASWNPLNLTAPGSGLPTINSVGVVALPSEQAGVQRTARLLQSGYPSIAKALATGKVNFQDPGLQADFNRWLTGNRTPGMSQYVSKIASSYGAPVPAGAGQVGAVPPAPSPPSPPRVVPGAPPAAVPPPVAGPPKFDPGMYRTALNNAFLTGGGRVDLSQMPSMFASSFKATELPPARPAPTPAAPGHPSAPGPIAPTPGPPPAGKEGVMQLPTKWKSTHITDGLGDQGFTHAEDIMGHPGTPVAAPEGGTVLYFHPTGAQGGGSMMIRADSGRTYWLGHIANGVQAGTKIKAGQVIAAISSDHPRPHVHIDYSTSYGG